MKLSLDFETFSEISVVDVGAWKYSEHPSTEVLCMAWAIDDEEPEIWLPHQPFPRRLLDAIEEGATLHAWNAVFEIAIWVNVLKRKLPSISQWRCSMAHAASCGFPLALEKAAIAARVKNLKDASGKRLLRKFSMPRKPTKKNPSVRTLPTDEPEEFQLLIDYCLQDVRAERDVVNALPTRELSAHEQRVWEFDYAMNRRGVRIDTGAVSRINDHITLHKLRTEEVVMEITGGFKTSQRGAILGWARAEGATLSGYTVADIKECLASEGVPDNVRTVLKARQSLGKTSTSKYAKILETVCSDGTCKGLVQYWGATTGRFAGRLIQVHNLPRGNYKNMEEIAPFVKDMALADFSMLYDDAMEAFSSLVRPMLLPRLGRKMFASDFSNIEGRVLAWMAGQADLVAQFASGDDVYKHMAATIFGTIYHEVTGDQRFVGKQAVLGCGYGMGGPKFLDTCLGYGQDIGLQLAQKTVNVYRAKNKCIAQSWYNVQDKVILAIRNPGTTFSAFMCHFRVEKGVLVVRLPSKRNLIYNSPEVDADNNVSYMGLDPYTKKWSRIHTYGGRFVENIVQAVARDLLVNSMLTVSENGYDVLMTVHDEVVSDAEDGTGGEEEFTRLMKSAPLWADGCPIEVETWSGYRYRK